MDRIRLYSNRLFALITAFSVFAVCFIGSFSFMPSVGVKAASAVQQFPDTTSIGGIAFTSSATPSAQIDMAKGLVDNKVVDLFVNAGYAVTQGAPIQEAITDAVVSQVLTDAAAGVVNEATTFMGCVGSTTAFATAIVGAGVAGFVGGAYSEYLSADPSIRQQYSILDVAEMGWKVYRDHWASAEEYEDYGFIGKALVNFATAADYVTTAFTSEDNPIVWLGNHMMGYHPENVASFTKMIDIGDYFIDDVYIPQNNLDSSISELPARYVGSADFQFIDALHEYWQQNAANASSSGWTAAAYDSAFTMGTMLNAISAMMVSDSKPAIPSTGNYMINQRVYRQSTPSSNTYNEYDEYVITTIPNDLYMYVTEVDGRDISVISTIDPSSVDSWDDCAYSTYGTRIVGGSGGQWTYQHQHKDADFNNGTAYDHIDLAYSANNWTSESHYYPRVTYSNGFNAFGLFGYYNGSYLAKLPGTSARNYYLRDMGFGVYDNSIYGPNVMCYQFNQNDNMSVQIDRRIFYSTDPIPIYRVTGSNVELDPVEIDSPFAVDRPDFTNNGRDIEILAPVDTITDTLIDIRDILTNLQPTQLINVIDEPDTYLQPIIQHLIDPETGLSLSLGDLTGVTINIEINIYNPTPTPMPLPDFPDTDGVDEYVNGVVDQSEGFISFLADIVHILPEDMILYLWGFLVIAVAGFMVSRFIG